MERFGELKELQLVFGCDCEDVDVLVELLGSGLVREVRAEMNGNILKCSLAK